MVLFSGFENLYTLQPFSTSEGRDLSGMCGYLTTDSRAFGLVTCPTGTNAYVGKFEVTHCFLFGDVGLAIGIIPKWEVNAHFILTSRKNKGFRTKKGVRLDTTHYFAGGKK